MSKYHSRKAIIDNITFDSQAEARYYRQLKMLKMSGEVIDFELQPTYILQEGYKRGKRKVQPITYKADFLVIYRDGRQEIVDVKGAKTEVYKIKKKLFEYKYPDLEITEVAV